MKNSTSIGLLIGFVSLVAGFMMEGGTIMALLQPTAALIVFGATIGATVASFSMEELRTFPQLLRIIFTQDKVDEKELVEQIVHLTDKARREGLLYLENYFEEIKDPYFKKGIQLIVDGAEPELIKSILETEIYSLEYRHKLGSDIFDVAGGYAPTMGIIGTVMGLIHVLGNITTPEGLGPAIAMAFMATLYGVGSANVIYFPLGAKLRLLSKKEVMNKEMILDGILSLQAGYNPILIRERLVSFLNPGEREREDDDDELGEIEE